MDRSMSSESVGGLGLRDPLHSNNIMGARIWWNWISKPHSPWGRLWQAKYAPGSPKEELIRFSSNTPGSLIWNAAKQSAFVQAHSFWEIHSSTTARFWEDSWQQLPKRASLFNKPKRHKSTSINYGSSTPQGFQLWKSANTWQAN